jgi:uncharacterized DUF497 family protein
LRFYWDEVNEQETAAHGIEKAAAEAVFFAEDRAIVPDPRLFNRFIAEGTVDSKDYRAPFSNVFPDGIRITTAFRVSRKRRRT